jgi:membrane protease YdiL (CAAX protease family)
VSEVGADAENRTVGYSRKLPMLAVLATAILIAYLPSAAAQVFFVTEGQSTNDWIVFIVLPIANFSLLLVLPITLIRGRPALAPFDCAWLRWTRGEFTRFWLMPLGVFAAAAIVALGVYNLGLPFGGREISFEVSDIARQMTILVWRMMLVVFLGPLAEEVFWRGYVQSALARVIHPVLAVVGRGILFGFIHFRLLLGFTEASLFGMIFGLWCWRRKTLVPVIIMHMAINGAVQVRQWGDWSELRQVRVTHDYAAELQKLSMPIDYDPNQDARGDYLEACQLVVQFPKDLERAGRCYPSQWTADEKSRAETWVASNAQPLKLVEKGARKPYYWPEYDCSKRAAFFAAGHLDQMRSLALALAMRAKLYAFQNRQAEALGDIESCCAMANHLLACKDCVSQITGLAVYGLCCQATRTILTHAVIEPTLMADLQHRLQTLRANRPIGFDLAAESFSLLDAIQRLFTDDGHGGGHLPRGGFRPGVSPEGVFGAVFGDMAAAVGSDIREWEKLDRRTTVAQVEEYYHAFGRATHLSLWEYETDAEGVKSTIARITAENAFIRVFRLNPKLIHFPARARVDLDSVITILAILRYRAERGRLPDSLELLAAKGYTEAVPDDPYSYKSLTYKRLKSLFAGDNPFIRDDIFLLYSWGADFDDDGGTPSRWGQGEKGGDQVFWPVTDEE